MVRITECDIFESGAGFIVHQVNCQGRMRSGIAKTVHDRYPEVYTKYHEVAIMNKDNPERLLGHVLYVPVNGPNKVERQIIVNIFGQNRYGYDNKQYTDYEALRKGFRHMAKTIPECNLKNKVVAIPFNIGCGLGGGDWEIVYNMIVEELSDLHVIICKLPEEELYRGGVM